MNTQSRKIFLTFLCAFFCLPFLAAQTPQENEAKYQHFRKRLREQFIYFSGDASIAGSHLPMELRTQRPDGKIVAYWADAVWWQGHYIAMLAIEHKLLTIRQLDASETLRELNLALDTYTRLDWAAEPCWNGTAQLNGFYLRDDIPQELTTKINADLIACDYKNACGKVETRSNAPSQDQAWGSYLGLALTKKLVADSAVQAKVRLISQRLVRAMQYSDGDKEIWEIVNPVTNAVVQTRADVQWLRFAHGAAGSYLTDNEIRFGKAKSRFWKDMWDLIQNNILIDKHGHFNWYGVLSISTVINEWGRGSSNLYDWLVKRTAQIAKKRPDLQQPLIFPHLPLIAVILHGYDGENLLAQRVYEDYLNTAPKSGGFHYQTADSVHQSNPPWHSLSLFCPWHTNSIGDFNMIDYMLLYNAYQLVYNTPTSANKNH